MSVFYCLLSCFIQKWVHSENNARKQKPIFIYMAIFSSLYRRFWVSYDICDFKLTFPSASLELLK